MKKFEVVNLEDLPKGSRFYFLNDGTKKIYEVIQQNNADTDIMYVAKDVKRTVAHREQLFYGSGEKRKAVFLLMRTKP